MYICRIAQGFFATRTEMLKIGTAMLNIDMEATDGKQLQIHTSVLVLWWYLASAGISCLRPQQEHTGWT